MQPEEELRYRLAVEKAISETTRLFIDHKDPDLNALLRILGKAVSANRAYIFRFRHCGKMADNTHEWCDPGTEPQLDRLQGLPSDQFPWWTDKIRKGENIVIRDVDALPEAAAAEKEILRSQDIRSLLVVPIRSVEGPPAGFMGFDDTRNLRQWTEEDARLLGVVAEVVSIYWGRRQAEKSRLEMKRRYDWILKKTPVWFWAANTDASEIYLASPGAEMLTGYSPEEFIRTPSLWFDLIPEEDREIVIRENEKARREKTTASFECRIRHRDGTLRWMYDVVIPDCDEAGELVGLYGFAVDITEKKMATVRLEQALQRIHQLSRRMLEAQELEYKSISRELHDNIAQNVNAVKMLLERLEKDAALWDQKEFSRLRQEIHDAVSLLRQTSKEIRSLSKQMRPEILDELGLCSALGSYAEDFQRRTGIRTDFVCESAVRHFSSSIETHLYRIAQEALSNVAKHARAEHAVVGFQETGNELLLCIQDDGIGFSTAATGREGGCVRGTGLLSMQERANILGGSFKVESAQGGGTKITVSVPPGLTPTETADGQRS